jgi:hypothetical protein
MIASAKNRLPFRFFLPTSIWKLTYRCGRRDGIVLIWSIHAHRPDSRASAFD